MPHTPGPYEAEHHPRRDCHMQPEYWTIEAVDANGKSRIVADTLNCDCTMSPDDQGANAKLLAAAPDAHDLLLAINEYFQNGQPVHCSALFDDDKTFKQAVESYFAKALNGAQPCRKE